MFGEKISDEQYERRETEMKNTTDFRKALDGGNLAGAEDFLNEVLLDPDKFSQYDERWLDHRQRELFQAFYKKEDWKGAKRIIEKTKDLRSKEGRINRLEELSGMNYEII
ncbi:hypothetical protein K8R62_03190 [bacterium]|nr:hypothetical protein [bacterium]